MATAQSKDIANLRQYITKLKTFLRKQYVWERSIANHIRRLKRKDPGGPGVTPPPPPPFKP